MTEEEKIKQALEAKFNYIKGAVSVKRERRMALELQPANFAEVFDYLVKEAGFSGLLAITGMDEATVFAVIYHLTKEGRIVLNLKMRIPRENPSVKTVTPYFPAADAYERELADLLGIKVEGLPPDHRYPLPDNWPEGQYPLRKEWRSSDSDEPKD
jgi:Ni,Fe-hydrogenase III component G